MSAAEPAEFLQRLAENLNSSLISLPSLADIVIKIRTALARFNAALLTR